MEPIQVLLILKKKNPELGEHADDIIDLYASYDSLTEKHSSEEDNKPLSTMSVYKADHYMMFSCALNT